jgi:hypothetical protein
MHLLPLTPANETQAPAATRILQAFCASEQQFQPLSVAKAERTCRKFSPRKTALLFKSALARQVAAYPNGCIEEDGRSEHTVSVYDE